MSSHREAPEISKDPVADNTDTYAFISPDRPDTVTIISNYIPLEDPAGGPNFFEFGDDVLYRINIDNTGEGRADIAYEFRFTTKIVDKNTFLYNTGPIDKVSSPNFNRPQTFTITEVRGSKRKVLGKDLASPPCNIGPRSTPNYANLANSTIASVGSGIKVFAGQRLDGFYVDLGAVFDLAVLRPFQNLHLIPTPAATPVNAVRSFNVHTIAIQVPIAQLTRNGAVPTDYKDPNAVIGVYASAYRQKGKYQDEDRSYCTGPFTQVSRLANPLFNEVIVPMSKKDRWNRLEPRQDKQFATYVAQPELAKLLPILYPGTPGSPVFPNLAALVASGKPRADLLAILLTGIPDGIIPGFQNLLSKDGKVQADLLRLNVAIPPTAEPKINGLIVGDAAGFPNGRRVFDNVVAIELRAIAGALYGLIDPSFTPDAASGILYDVVSGDANDHPVSGYDVKPLSVAAAS
jgi:hypothetical protein